jgi:hypothetical protein
MNEIIAKLYDQALVIENGGDYVSGELDPVKFAELIIKDQQRTWVGLTDEEALDCAGWSVSNIARNAEAKLKEKNT